MNKAPVRIAENLPTGLLSVPADSFLPESWVTDDELLIRRALAVDAREGFAFLFRRYHTNLCNHAIRFVYSRALAEDLVAEVFAELWSNRRFEQINTSYRAYLYKAVRHRAFNALKKELSRNVSTEDANTQLASPMQTPDQVMQYNELQQKVEAIIQNLPPQCRRAFLLHRLEVKRYEDIGRELSITTSAVERLISRALARLRQELKAGGFISLLFMLFFH